MLKECVSFVVTHYYNVAQQIIVSCILSISSLTIITSFVAMVVSAGFPRERLEFLRHYSVFNVVSCELMFVITITILNTIVAMLRIISNVVNVLNSMCTSHDDHV